MTKEVLWLDNDISFVTPYKEQLEAADFKVTVVRTVGEAARKAMNFSYDLIILDVMIPTKGEAEELEYPPAETEMGHKTGLVFYRRIKSKIPTHTKVLVLTVMLDESVKEEFLAAELPAKNFATKFSLRTARDFCNRVDSIMND